MATFSKVLLSAAVQGKAIKVAASATPGTSLHVTGVSASILDEVWLYAFNSAAADAVLTLEFGGATAPDQNIVVTIPFRAGLVLVVPGLLLCGDGAVGATVKAFASVSNVITLSGFLNRIS
jgi:hypothetical protein